MKEEHIVRRMIDVDIPGKRRRGRPNLRWKDAWEKKRKKKGMVLYSAVSSPLDRSKRFTLSSPGRPVHSDTVIGFSWKHPSHAAIAQRLFTHISTTVYSQVLIYTAESTEASWSERKCPNFETVTTGIRTRALSIASPAFYQLSYRVSKKTHDRGGSGRGQDNKQGSLEEYHHQLYRRPQMTGKAREE